MNELLFFFALLSVLFVAATVVARRGSEVRLRPVRVEAHGREVYGRDRRGAARQ